MVKSVVQHIKGYLSTKTKSYLGKGWNKQNTNSGVGILPKIPRTETTLNSSHNTLVLLHAEKLVRSGTDNLRYRSSDKCTSTYRGVLMRYNINVTTG